MLAKKNGKPGRINEVRCCEIGKAYAALSDSEKRLRVEDGSAKSRFLPRRQLGRKACLLERNDVETTIEYRISEIHRLRPDPRNARTHSKKQVNQIAASIAENGFANPILINPSGSVIAGHGRLRAAKQLLLNEVPTMVVTGLSEAQERRLRIAENKIALNAGWDMDLLKLELNEIELAGLDLSLFGFSIGEIDAFRAWSIVEEPKIDPVPIHAVTRAGDIWLCGEHRIGCGDLLDGVSLKGLMAGDRADALINDPPYNTSNATHCRRRIARAVRSRSCSWTIITRASRSRPARSRSVED